MLLRHAARRADSTDDAAYPALPQFDNAEVYAHGKSELIMGQAFKVGGSASAPPSCVQTCKSRRCTSMHRAALHYLHSTPPPDTHRRRMAHAQPAPTFLSFHKELDIPRQNVVISTKIFFGATPQPAPTARGLSRKHIIEGLRASLLRLGMPYVDIVFAHRPDPETPMEETVRAFNWVIDQGWAHYWGTSEWSASQIMEVSARTACYHLGAACRPHSPWQRFRNTASLGPADVCNSRLACG